MQSEALQKTYHVGTAGWAIPKQHGEAFGGSDSHLERYGRSLPAVEINSTFYRSHRPATYARWAASVPLHFRFSAKIPREITHKRRLAESEDLLDRFLGEVEALGPKLGPLLVQLPPGLRYDAAVAERFFASFRERFDGLLGCEPRNETWFDDAPEALMRDYHVARIAADPAIVPRAAESGGWPGLVYIRLHGSPKVYSSPYSPEQLDAIAADLRAAAPEACERWCIFDNTVLGEAAGQALDLMRRLS